MGRIKNIFVFMFLIGCFIYPAGCISTQKKETTQVPSQKLAAETKPMITTAIRILPETCKPGDIITVRIDVIPRNNVSGIIITEKVPDHCRIIQAEPNFSKVLPDGSYKWLEWAKQLAPFRIVYKLEIPESAKGKYNFEGFISTYDQGNMEIIGQNYINVQ
ncbi:MAG TPA: hypothetical protein PKX05_03020 [bacterium]|nr:hypothetical protein [bacterium]